MKSLNTRMYLYSTWKAIPIYQVKKRQQNCMHRMESFKTCLYIYAY